MFCMIQRHYPWQQWLAVGLIFLAGVINSGSGLQHAHDGWEVATARRASLVLG